VPCRKGLLERCAGRLEALGLAARADAAISPHERTRCAGRLDVPNPDRFNSSLHPKKSRLAAASQVRFGNFFKQARPLANFEDKPAITAAVPEPSPWAMMILGFASLGFTAYRRKRKPGLNAA